MFTQAPMLAFFKERVNLVVEVRSSVWCEA